MSEPITIVSGLPRSGTSLMMRMLEAAGLGVVSDGERAADDDNPRGYYELERVKKLPDDVGWLPECEGKAVKVISRLMMMLPEGGYRYRVIFMRRNLDEILRSQKKMLERRGEDESFEDAEMKKNFILHVGEIEAFVAGRDDFEVLFVNYNRLMSDPAKQIQRVAEFLGRGDRIDDMTAVVEPGLYRQRA
ncbi:MAG: sulfotransferase domain-containing protein [Deltaproteobacteria bacterium]